MVMPSDSSIIEGIIWECPQFGLIGFVVILLALVFSTIRGVRTRLKWKSPVDFSKYRIHLKSISIGWALVVLSVMVVKIAIGWSANASIETKIRISIEQLIGAVAPILITGIIIIVVHFIEICLGLPARKSKSTNL